MAESTNKRPSTKVRRTAPNSYWLNNAMKSIGMGLLDYAEEVIPSISYMTTTVTKDAADFIRDQKKDNSALKLVSNSIKNSETIKGAKEVFKNTLTDLRSGKFVGNDRESEDAFGFDDLNSAIDSLDDVDFSSFGDEDNDSSTQLSVKNDNRVNVIDNSATKLAAPMTESIRKVGEAQVKATAALSSEIVEIGSKILFQSKRTGDATIEKLSSIDSRLAAINDFNNNTMAKLAQSSIAYYESMLKKEEDQSSSNNKEDLFDNGKLNIKTYLSGMKDRFTEEASKLGDGLVGLVMTSLPMFIDTMKENPIEQILTGVLKNVIPAASTVAVKSLDKAFENFVPAMLTKLADYKYKGNSDIAGGFLEFFAHVLGRKDTVTSGISLNGVTKDAVQWDNRSRHTLIDTIPKYLREISAYTRETSIAITGKTRKELDDTGEMFNFSNGKYGTRGKLQDEFFTSLSNAATESFNDSAFSNELDSVLASITDKNKKADFNNILNQLKFALTINETDNNGISRTTVDTVNRKNDVLSMVDSFNADNETKSLLKAALLSLTDDARLSVAAAQQKAVRSYNDFLKNVSENQADYRLADVYSDTTLSTDKVYKDVMESNRNKGSKSADIIRSQQNIKNSLGNTPIAIMGDIRAILLRGINVRLDRKTKSLYDSNIPSTIENVSGQPTYIQPVPEVPNSDNSSQQSVNPNEDLLKNTREIIEAANEKAKTSDISSATGFFGDELERIDSLRERNERTSQRVEKYANKGKKILYSLIYGNTNQLADEVAASVTTKAMDIGTTAVNKFVTPVFDYVTKDDPASGRKSIATLMRNQVDDTTGSIQHYLFGKGYTKSDGTEVKELTGDQMKDSVAGQLKTTLKTVTTGIKEYIFGKKENSDGETNEEDQGFLKTIKDQTAKGFLDWRDLVFGEETENTPKARQEAVERVEKFAIKSIPNAALGSVAMTGVGMLAGNSILGAALGGPIGALAGAATGIAMSSDTFRERVFGKEDQTTGEWVEGIIPKSTQDWLKENSSTIMGGAAIGTARSLIIGGSGGLLGSLVGGPLAGAVVGAGAAFVKKSDSFQKFLYGEDIKDEQGNIIRHANGVLERIGFSNDAKINEKTKRMGLSGAIGGGLLGAVMLHPVLGASLGLASGILGSNEKFQELMFGKKGSDGKRDRNSSVFGRIFNFLNLGIFQPLTMSIKKLVRMVGHNVKYNILKPLGIAIQPLLSFVRKIGSGIKGIAHGLFSAITFPARWIGKKIWNSLFKGKIARFFGGAIRKVMNIPRLLFSLGANMFKVPMYMIASGSSIGNTIGTFRRKTIGNVFNFDNIRENMTDENGQYKTGLAAVKGFTKGLGSNIRTSFDYLTNKDGMLTDAIVDENGGLARDTFRQMRENEKERKESRKRILEDYKWDRASNIYQAALSGALGYTIAPNRYGVVDMDTFNDRLSERAQKMADKHNRSAESLITGKRDADYYKNQLMNRINKQSKAAYKAMGVDNFEDFNAKMMARIDPTTGKSVAELMSDRKVDPEERKYRDDMVKNFQDVNADTDNILEQLIQIRTNSLADKTGIDPDTIAGNLRKQMNEMRDLFNSTDGDVTTKRAAVFGKFMGNNKAYTYANTKPKNSDDDNEVSDSGHAKGTKRAKKGITVVGENGPELVRFSGGEEVVAANKINQAMGKAYKSDLAIMRSKPNQLSIQERMLSAILTIRSVLVGTDPARPFNFNNFQRKISSSIKHVGAGISNGASTVKSAVNNTMTNVGDVLSSVSGFFDGPDINAVDDDYNDSEVINNINHSSSLTDVLTNGGDANDVANALKVEESRKTVAARVKDVTSKSYQNLKEEEREQATKLAPVRTAETLERMEGENTKQNSIWRSIFGKDSLIAGALVIGVPLILKLVKKLLNLDISSILNNLGSSIVGAISTTGKSILSGLTGAFKYGASNYERETEHGDVNNDGEMISSGESALDTSSSMIANIYNGAGSLISGNITDSADSLWQASHGTKEYNNEITNMTSSVGKATFGTVKNVVNSKTGAKITQGLDVVGTKLVQSPSTGVISRVKNLFTAMFRSIADSTELKAKFGQGVSAKVAQLAITITGKFEQVANNTIVQKIAQGFAVASAKITTAASTVVGLLLNDTVFALAGGLDRMTATAKLFKVSKEYASGDSVMLFIAAAMGTILSTSVGLYFDVIFSVLETAGIDLLGMIAVSLYNIIMTATGEDAKIEGLEEAQQEWYSEYEKYYNETMSKQATAHNAAYNTNYTTEEFINEAENGNIKEGVDYQSFADWNANQNASVMTNIANDIGTKIRHVVSDDFEASWVAEDGTKYTLVRNDSGTFDMYDEQGKNKGIMATLPEGAEMKTAEKDKYQGKNVSDSIYSNKTYWSKDNKRYYIYNGKTFDEYNASTNKQTGLFHNGTMSVDQFNALTMTGDILTTRDLPTNSIIAKYGQGRMWVNTNGDIYMLDDQSYLSTLSEKWYVFSSNGELKAIVSPDDKKNLDNIHKAIDDGTLVLKTGTNLYNIDLNSKAAFDSNLGEQNIGSTGVDYLSSYLNNLSSSDVIGVSEEEHNTMIANESLISKNKKANDNLWDKYGGTAYYDNTGYKYIIDAKLRATTGGISFMKYTSSGDFIKYISSGDKEFNKILQAIDDGTITKNNPLDNKTIMKAKKISVDVNKMSNDELEDYVDGCNKALKEGRLGDLYSNGYNDVLMNDIDTENVGWFYPETGAYYVRTNRGFEAYNANGSLIGVVSDVPTIAKIYMQIETGMLTRGIPISATINQAKTATTTMISGAISANAATAPTGTVVGGTNSLVTGTSAINAATAASGGVATDAISGNSTILSGNPSTSGISIESYLAAYQKMCESLAYNDITKKNAIQKLEKSANYDLDEDGTIGSATNLKGTNKGKSALSTIGSSNISINSDGTISNNNNNSDINMKKNGNNKTSDNNWSLSGLPGGKGEENNSSEFGTSDKVYGHAYLSQSDAKWKNDSYDQTAGTPESSDTSDYTIGTRGCGPTTLAMVANDLTGSKLTPSDVSRDAERFGYSDQTGTNWSFMNDAASLYGISSSGIHKPDIKWIDASLALGKPVIMSGTSSDINSPYTGAGHYVVVYRKTSGGYQVADPRGKSSSKVYSGKELFNGANASWSFAKNDNPYINKNTVKKLLLTRSDDNIKNGGFGNAYLSKMQKQKLVDQMITWKANSSFRYNLQKDNPKSISSYMTGKTGMTIEPLLVQLFSSALGINLLDSGISRRGQGLSCTVFKEISPSDRHFGDICYVYSSKGSFGGVLSSSSEYVGFKDASQWGRINTVKLTTSLASKFKYYRYFGPAGLSTVNNTTKNDKADTYNVDANASSVGIGGGDPTAINSPYRGKFRVSQEFKGTKFPSQKSGNHDGFDLVGVDSKTLYSTIAGVVVKAGWENEGNHSQGFGQYVKVEDSANPGTFYYYGHMSEIKVKQGDTVAYGTPIGTEGSTGRSTGSHCHYCIRSTTGDSRQNGCLDVATMSNIPNEQGTYEDNGTYGSQVATATVDPTTGAVTTTVQNQNIFDKISVGLSNIISKTWNGIATDDWDHDWSNILGNQSSTLVQTQVPGSSSSGTVNVSGDYIGKYVKEFESGDKGSACISTGQGDPRGGPSFGTFQFPSYWKSKQTSADGNLYKFWNKYYAASNPDVTPGDNDEFKARWKQLAEADPEGFFANEYAFCFPDYYLTARNSKKFVGSVNPDKHRSWQESFWSTAIQFGAYSDCWNTGHSGYNDNSDEADTIEHFQNYKAGRVSPTRHRGREKQLLLSLVGQAPIDYSSLVPAGTTNPLTGGGNGDGPSGKILTKTPNIKNLLEKAGINNVAKAGQDYEGYHPQIGGSGEYEFSDVEKSPESINGFAYYSQNDSRWADNEYRQTTGENDGDPQYMANRGCGPTVLAMAAKGLTGENINPMDTAGVAEKYGYSDETGTNWSFMNDAPSLYGISSTGVENPSVNFVEDSLRTGRPVILSGYSDDSSTPYTKAGHYVLAVGEDNGRVKINDPRGKKYSKSYSVKTVADNASAAWSLDNIGKRRNVISKLSNSKSYKYGGKGYTTADFVAACSMACSELGRNNWSYSQSAVRSYDMNGKTVKARSDCSGMVSAALIYLGVLSSPWSSGDFTNESNASKITSQLPMKFIKTSTLSSSDWDNLPPGTILCSGGYHVEVLMGWADGDKKNAIVYSGGSGPSKQGYRSAYGWQEGMVTVPPYSSTWGGNSYRSWPTCAYVPTDGGAQYSGGTVVPANGSNTTGDTANTSATSIGSMFDALSTGIGTISTKTWDGIATGEWDHDWSDILTGTTSTTATDTQTTTTSNSDVTYTAGQYPVQYPAGAPSYDSDQLKNFMNIMIGNGAIQSGISGNILPSIKLGQAAFESGYATSSLFKNTNNLYGMRSGALQTGTYQTSGNGKFASYDSPAQSIADHTRLLNNSNYGSTVPGATNYRAAAQAMVNAGYCSDSGYVDRLASIIESNGFDYFDKPEAMNFYKSLSPTTGSASGDRDKPLGGKGGNSMIKHSTVIEKIGLKPNMSQHAIDYNNKPTKQSGGNGEPVKPQEIKITSGNMEKLTNKIIELLSQLVEIETDGNDKLDEINVNGQVSSGKSSIITMPGKNNSKQKVQNRSEVIARMLAKA